MENNLPEDLVKSSVEKLGPEIRAGKFHRYRNNVWDRVIRNFNNEYDSSDFINGKVTNIKTLDNDSLCITIADVEEKSINIYCTSSDMIKNAVKVGATIGAKGDYKLYKDESMSDAVIQFIAKEIVNLEVSRSDLYPLLKFLRANKANKEIKFIRRRNLKVALITSSISETRDDIKNILDEYYVIDDIVVNLADKRDIARTISSLNDSDVDIILLPRGITEKLSIYNSYEVLNSIYRSNKVVVTALGYVSFKSIADSVSDYSFNNASAAAYELNGLLNNYRYKRNKNILIASVAMLFILLMAYFIK